MSETIRFYKYKELFNSRRVLSKETLLKELEISPATLKRDLAKFRDQMNTPIVFDKELRGYKLDKSTDRVELPGLFLSQEEILGLLTIQNMIQQLEPGLIGSKLKPLRQRLNSILQSQGLDSDQLSQRVREVHAGKRRLELKHFEAVALATLERKRLRIRHYNRQTDKHVDREISPQQLVHYRDNWYVDAKCHLRKDVRSFAIDAIEACEILDKSADELNTEVLREKLGATYGIFGGEPKDWAVLKFTKERARWVQFEEWHPKQRKTLHIDGSLTLEVPYSDERELLGDVLRYGSEVEVISPLVFRNKVEKALVDSIRNLNIACKG